MGRSMMEAINVGTHIIATDVGGTRELFTENEGIGYLVKPATYSLTDAFNSIRHLTSISLKLGKDYSWQHVFSEYKKLIDKYEINKFGRN